MRFETFSNRQSAEKFAKENHLDHVGPIHVLVAPKNPQALGKYRDEFRVNLYMGHYENVLLSLENPKDRPVYGEFSVEVWNHPEVRWAVLVKDPKENFPWPTQSE